MAPRPPAETRVLVCDDLHPDGLELLRRSGFQPELLVGRSEDELVAEVPGAHALLVRSATRVTERVLQAATELELVGRAGVGVDNVDVAAATARGVVVMNTPTGNTVTTAELALSLICSLARNVPRADRQVRAGSWSKKGLMGSELTGKTLGVVGLGRIGKVLAERALGLRMRVVAHDPYLSATGSGSPLEGVELLELDDLLARADFVSLHVPLTDATRNLLSRERLFAMKPGARLVNAARGGLVDEHALAEALEAGHLAGAALDVLLQEPPPADHPLLTREDVILTPHLGASSHEAQRNVSTGVAEQLVAFFVDGVAHNAVNAPAVDAGTLRELGPYVVLAERLGSFLAQRVHEPIQQLELTLSGEVAAKDRGYLKLAFLVAALRQSLDLGVNFVNAPLLAEQRGVRLLEGKASGTEGFTSLITARARSAGETRSVSGTVFGAQPRIVRVDGMPVDFAPEGHLLVTRHTDRPGVLGAIGTVLGELGVNIRRVELGPAHEGDEAYASAFLSLYDAPPPQALERIRALEPVASVVHVEL